MLLVFLFTLVSVCCLTGSSQRTATADDVPALKAVFGQDFAIGAALNRIQIAERDVRTTGLITRQFNALTPENDMKAVHIHPQWDRYDFTQADKIVQYGRKYQLSVNAHTLIWHSQLPAFVRHINSKDSLRRFFEDHIRTIAARYDGQVYSWDVVNEALNEDGTMRRSVFLEMLGDDYVVEAFRLAQQATPKSKLYYNDYNIEQPAKRAGAIALIRRIQAAGVRIDGVGIQGHWHLDKVPFKDIEESIRAFSLLGIDVMFTELDISVLPDPQGVNGADVSLRSAYDTTLNPYAKGLPDAIQNRLAANYADLFRLFLTHSDKISRVTFWGVNDGDSWLNNWPVRGRTNYPLLFDRQCNAKAAFYKVIAGKTDSAGTNR